MPTVKDKTTGQVVAELPYDAQGKAKADQMVQASPNLEIDYAPGGASDTMGRSQTMYAGGGKTGYNVPQYKKGGAVEGMGKEALEKARKKLGRSNPKWNKKITKKQKKALEKLAKSFTKSPKNK